MNYKDMVFTDKDREMLRKNKKMIIDWIMKNIIPDMELISVIKCDFGDIYRSQRTNTPVKSYHLYVYSETKEFCSSGGSVTNGYIGYGQNFVYMSKSFESVTSPYDIYPIVDNWSFIKKTLINGIKEQQRSKSVIYDFNV